MPSSSRPSGTSRALVLWGPVGLYALAIFIESSISQVPALPSGFTDKDGHGLLYAGLAVLVLRAASGARWEGVTLRAAAAAVAFGPSTASPTNSISGSCRAARLTSTTGSRTAAVLLRLSRQWCSSHISRRRDGTTDSTDDTDFVRITATAAVKGTRGPANPPTDRPMDPWTHEPMDP